MDQTQAASASGNLSHGTAETNTITPLLQFYALQPTIQEGPKPQGSNRLCATKQQAHITNTKTATRAPQDPVETCVPLVGPHPTSDKRFPHLVLAGLWWVGAKTQPASAGQLTQTLLCCNATPCTQQPRRLQTPTQVRPEPKLGLREKTNKLNRHPSKKNHTRPRGLEQSQALVCSKPRTCDQPNTPT